MCLAAISTASLGDAGPHESLHRVPDDLGAPARDYLYGINNSGTDRVRAQIAAQQQTVLSSEISAKLTDLPFKEGDSFRLGQVLADFDCSIQIAQLGKFTAIADAARQTLEVYRRLSELNSISALEVAVAEGKLKEADAEVAALRATLAKCSILAPFSGRVAKVNVENHQFVPQGKPLIEVVDPSRLEARLIVPSRWISWLKKGSRFTVNIDETNRGVLVEITRIGARIDPVNQTIFIVGAVIGKHGDLLPGMSGWAHFGQASVK